MKCLSTFNSMYTNTNYTNLFSIRSKAFCYHNQKKKDTQKLYNSFLSLLHFEAVVPWWKCVENGTWKGLCYAQHVHFFRLCIPVEIFWVYNIWNITSKFEVLASQDNNPLKRRRLDDSPSKNVDICCHCNKKCTKKSEAVQCDLCYSWLHASCEGLNKEQYKLLTHLYCISLFIRQQTSYCNLCL